MKAIIFNEKGSVDVLGGADVPTPTPKAGEVLIRVKSTSVNPLDWKYRAGKIPGFKGSAAGKILGFDVSGTVEKVGPGATLFSAGDPVFGLLNTRVGGAYAQYVVAHESWLARKPSNLSLDESAALPLVCLTSLQAFAKMGDLAGKKILIVGGSGGVGTVAIQIAKAMGAHVTATCSEKNASLVKELGADVQLDDRAGQLPADETQFDGVFDTVTGLDWNNWKRYLKPSSTVVVTLPTVAMIRRVLLSKFSGPKFHWVMVKPNSGDILKVKQWVETGKLKPVIQSISRADEIKQAHKQSEAGHVVGKIIIRFS